MAPKKTSHDASAEQPAEQMLAPRHSSAEQPAEQMQHPRHSSAAQPADCMPQPSSPEQTALSGALPFPLEHSDVWPNILEWKLDEAGIRTEQEKYDLLAVATSGVEYHLFGGGDEGIPEPSAFPLMICSRATRHLCNATRSAAQPATSSAAVLHSLHPVLGRVIWENPELSSRLWDLMRLQDKACSRCTCRSDHQRITTHAFVEQLLKEALCQRRFLSEPFSVAVRPQTSDQCFARCKELSVALRQAQLARKVLRGEIPDGQEAFACTNADVKEMLNEWKNDWSGEHYNALAGLGPQRLHQCRRAAFNAYLFQETGGHKRLLFGFLHFDMIHFDLPSLPVLVQLLDDLPGTGQ